MIDGFKKFILRGNVIDLAVAFVIGAAFATVVSSLVDGIINPLVAAVFGQPDLSAVGQFTVNHAVFMPGLVLSALLNFLFVAAAVYVMVVAPMNALAERRRRGVEPEPEAPAEDILLLQEIRDLLAVRRDI
jgi:large conductance mechanosensitive channel